MNGTQCCRRVLSSAAIALLFLFLALPAAAAKLGDVPEVFR